MFIMWVKHDHGHVHLVPQNTVLFDVRTCRRRRRRQTEGFARKHTTEQKMVMTGGWFMIVVPTSYHMDIMDNMDTIGGWTMVRWCLDIHFFLDHFG